MIIDVIIIVGVDFFKYASKSGVFITMKGIPGYNEEKTREG